MIEIKELYKNFDNKVVLNNISFTINEKGITGLMATSGAGKTTIINIILGFLNADSGSINNLPNNIAVVFQEDRLLEWITPLKNIKICENIELEKIDKIFNQFKIDNTKPVSKLSGGMKRRVAIARAILYKSEFIILDEPFKGLDDKTKKIVMDIIIKESEKKPILFITHNIDEIKYFNLNNVEYVDKFKIYK